MNRADWKRTEAVRQAVRDKLARGPARSMAIIAAVDDRSTPTSWRRVDRAVQTLRRLGEIRLNAKREWELVSAAASPAGKAE